MAFALLHIPLALTARVYPVRPDGGENLKAKVEVGLRFPEYPSAIAIRHFIQHADLWKEASIAANAGANFYTYTYYLSEVKRLFKNAWNLEL